MSAEHDDLMPPEGLRRNATPESRLRVAAVVREVLGGGNREWVMSRKDKYVSKLGIYIENRAAPVKAEHPDAAGTAIVEVGSWPNMDEFEAWYKPKFWKCLGAVHTSAEATFLHLEPIEQKAGTGGKVEPKAAKPARGPTVRKAYIVNSHIGLVLKAHGFRAIVNGDDEPLTFSHPAGHQVVILPPAPDKKSSSDWQLTEADKAAETGRGLALDKRLEGIK